MHDQNHSTKTPAKLLVKILIFGASLLIAYLFLENQLSKVPNLFVVRRNYLERQLNTTQLLILGSSHGDSFNPHFFTSKAFSLNFNSQDFYYDQALLNKYIDQMPNLKTVIIPISFFSLDYQVDRSLAWTLAPYYHHFWGIPPQHWDSLLSMRYFSLTAMYGFEMVKSYLKNGFDDGAWKNMSVDGWIFPEEGELNDSPQDRESGQKRIASLSKLMIPNASSENLQILENIMRMCQSQGIQLVLITTPAHHTFYDPIDPFKWRSVQETILAMAEKYGFRYKDYLKDARFSNLDYRDHDHLNFQGSEKFSRIIDQEVIQPLLLSGGDEFNACPRVSEKPCMIK